VGALAGLALVCTVLMAWPVVVSPRQMMFGSELVGRHHDAYTVMAQMAGASTAGVYAQPLTDRAGWLLARVFDPVAAFNVLVLLTFPLSVATAYALGRYLRLSTAGAIVAGFVYAFAPVHLAHAAYHPHIAQTQWLPLYFLALFAMVDAPSIARGVWLAAASAAAVLSNDYAGWTIAVLTPIALPLYAATSARLTRRWAAIVAPAITLALIALAGIATVARVAPDLLTSSTPFGASLSDVARYSARWWAFFVPPVDHAVLGGLASEIARREGIGDALVENQIYLGYAFITLAVIPLVAAFFSGGARRWTVPARLSAGLLGIACIAALVAVGPLSGECRAGSWAPACRLHDLVPVFRSYARFAIVTELMVALAAGVGVTWCIARGSAKWRAAAFALVMVGTFEYWPWPWRAHDVLPTMAHRWVAEQPATLRAIDCSRPGAADALVPWLMRRPLAFLGGDVENCSDPDGTDRLAALGYTHAIRRQTPDPTPTPPGLTVAAAFSDAVVYAVSVSRPPVVTMASRGFFDREFRGQESWRWMSEAGEWTVRNTTSATRTSTLLLELSPAGSSQTIALTLDGRPAGTIHIVAATTAYRSQPLQLAPGDHTLTMTALEPAVRPADAGATDPRRLTVMFRAARGID